MSLAGPESEPLVRVYALLPLRHDEETGDDEDAERNVDEDAERDEDTQQDEDAEKDEDAEEEEDQDAETDADELENLEWRWTCILEVPIAALLRIDGTSPCRWLFFACITVLGTTKGRLCQSQDAVTLIDLDRAQPSGTEDVYFFVKEEDRASMFPAEPDLCKSRTGSLDAKDKRRKKLWELVVQRDKRCVVTNFAAKFSEASHLIPHAKGDMYILNLTKAHEGAAEVSDIDSIRNAILLTGTLHTVFGKSVAIMQKPNPAYPEAPASWTFHVLDDSDLPPFVEHGKAVNTPANKTNWPQSLLFDQVYAAAILNTFGNRNASRDALKRMSRAYYGTHGPKNALQRVQHQIDESRIQTKELENFQKQTGTLRGARGSKHSEDNEDLPQFAVWQSLLPPNTQRRLYERLLRTSRKKAAAASRDRVVAWQRTVEV